MKLLVTISFILAFSLVKSQDSIYYPLTSRIIDFDGYKKTGKIDTVKIVILITECDDCTSKSVSAYAVREQSTYHGDRMPPLDYSDYWTIKSYLDNRKKPFPPKVIIWDNRIK